LGDQEIFKEFLGFSALKPDAKYLQNRAKI
jgi:hypothetical protein